MKTQSVRSGLKHFIGVLLIVLLLEGIPTRPAAAAVTNRYVNGATGSDSGDCTSSPCLTIAYAISKASSDDTIRISAGTYTENLYPNKNLDFIGAGMNATILDGGGTGTVMTISSATYVVNLTGLTVTNGASNNTGGGIANSGTLSLTRVKVTGNSANTSGGGIASAGPLSMTDSVISNNTAGVGGGGLSLDISNPTVNAFTRVTINGNTAAIYGGGMNIQTSGTLTLNLTNVTINGNTTTSGDYGGGISNTYTIINILNSTIANNQPSNAINNHGTVNLKNTIIANNGSVNCFNASGSTLHSDGNNLESLADCNFTQAGDLQNTDPLLGTLADNGGLTRTKALLTGSPAIDAGADTGCPATDQRGVARPQGPHCDIGAFEAEIYTLTIVSTNGTVARNPDKAFYHEGDVVQLTATPNTGWSFVNWAGGLNSSVNPDSVTIHGDTSVTANYIQIIYPIYLPLVIR
jgi:hypothetical protein